MEEELLLIHIQLELLENRQETGLQVDSLTG